MGQTIDNVMGHTKDTAAQLYGVCAGAQEKGLPAGVATDVNAQPENPLFSEPATNTKINTTMEQFEEYLKKKQEKAKEAGQDEEALKEREKEAAKELRRSLSSEEIKQLERMGVDVEGAGMSDLIGMVNTMRHNAHREETAQLLAQTKADNGDIEDLTLVGGNVKITGTDVKLDSVSVSDVLSASASEAGKAKGTSAAEAGKAREASAAEAGKVKEASAAKMDGEETSFAVGDSELIYLIRNRLPFTKENMYKAHFSGSRPNETDMDERAFADMLPQVEKVIAQAGFAGEEKAVAGAKFLMSNELLVTTDSVKAYMEFQEYAGKPVDELPLPENMEEAEYESAKKLYEDVKKLTPELAVEMSDRGQTVTVAAMLRYASQKTPAFASEEKSGADDETYARLTLRRQVEEIRLAMTMEASGRLVKMDINIDTRELSRVVDALREMEAELAKEKLAGANAEPTQQNIELYHEMSEKIEALGAMPARVLAAPLRGVDFTVNALLENEPAAEERNFETVRRSYEAVGTAPRADMGDSIAKAFSNVDDILRERNLPVDEENRRAVRILGYNSMELSEENIREVVYFDRQVNELMDTFYPEAVLGMIKDGINPLDVPIDDLNRTIRMRNYNEGVTEAENFASYLRDMEDKGVVSKEERESYIGIYRMMHKLAKSGDREAGWVFANKSRLTIRNLLSAMRSRKASGIDISVDEDFGMLEETVLKSSRIDEQIAGAFSAKERNSEDSLAVEEKKENLRRFAKLGKDVEDFLAENQITYSIVNALAADTMLHTGGGIYQLVSDLLAKLKFHTEEKEKMVDEETEHMTDSLLGEEISADIRMENILESIGRNGGLSLKYDDLRDKLTELMYEGASGGVFTAMDISAIKTVNAGFHILSGMAGNDRYQIPVETGQGIRVMNLSILHGRNESAGIRVEITGEQMGFVQAKVTVGADGALRGYLVSETSEGNYALRRESETFRSELAGQGFDGSAIFVGRVENGRQSDAAENSSEDSRQLYDAAVALVRAVGNILC